MRLGRRILEGRERSSSSFCVSSSASIDDSGSGTVPSSSGEEASCVLGGTQRQEQSALYLDRI